MKELLTKEEYDNAIKLFKSIKNNDEYELDLNKQFTLTETGTTIAKPYLTYNIYYKLLRFLKVISQKNNYEIINKNILDINYSISINDEHITYRISILNPLLINRYVSRFKDTNNISIFTSLLHEYENGTKGIEFYKKIKKESNILNLPEINARIRKSAELPVISSDIKNLKSSAFISDNIIFRLKNRLSVITKKNKDNHVVIDLTKTNQTKNGLNFKNSLDNYELEIEYFNEKGNPDILMFDEVLTQSSILLKVIQSSNFIIKNSEKEAVLNLYKVLMNPDKEKTKLDSSQVKSIEITHLNVLYNKYAVTDKADGEHAFLIICNQEVFIISQNLDVTKTGIILDNDKFNDSILDGEIIFLKKENRYIFMVFDCLFFCGEKILEDPILLNRLKKSEELITKCFVFDKQTYRENKNIHTLTKMNDILNFYKQEIPKYFNQLNHDIQINKNLLLVRPKYFMFPIGIEENEVYKYSEIFWNIYNTIDYYPYNLDGLVYQPINQIYKDKTLQNIKWKPEENNTIDFYIEFIRDPKTIKIRNVFNNAIDETEILDTEEKENKITTKNNNIYRICYLYVGSNKGKTEIPTLFNPRLNNPNHNVYIANLLLDEKSNTIKDAEGHIVQDKTVVEFYYKNDPSIDEKFRWMPLRTRFDKTEQVQKFHRNYGNYEIIANSIWFSIQYPITFGDIKILADSTQYIKHKITLLSKIENVENISSTSYFNQESKLLKSMIQPQHDFHGFVKSILINSYLKPEFNRDKKCSVLDIGVGRGGDIMKYFNAEIGNLVGIDKDFDGIHNPGDGAISRYNRVRRQYPNFPYMTFINADITKLFDSEIQLKTVQDKTPENHNNIIKYLNGKIKYDVISCQFAFHYFLQNEETFKNTCDNINKVLKDNGLFIMTTFDAQRITKLLKENNGLLEQYLIHNDEKIMFHGLQQKYEEQKIYGLGNMVNVKVCSFMPDYYTEYLVDDQFIIPELYKRCKLQLIETDYFENVYDNFKSYIIELSQKENKKNMKSFLEKAARFYEENDINNECRKITNLNRYYVFKKFI